MDKRVTKICKTCGREMKVKPSQSRKVMCTECAYEIKKIRSSEMYWSKKAPGSTRHQYWEGRYQSMNKLLNK